MKKGKRFIALILVMVLTIATLPNQAYAQGETSPEQTNVTNEPSSITDDTNPKSEEMQVIGEDVSKRTLNSKTFIMSDHSYKATIYKENVHYKENGEYKNIDNSLSYDAAENADDFNGYENKNNSFKIKFAKNVNAAKLISIRSGNYGLSWNYVNASSQASDAEIPDITTGLDTTENSQFKVDKNISEVNYNNIESGIDLQYFISGSNVKENIVVNNVRDDYTFTFNLKLDNLNPKLNEDGSISIYDSASQDNEIYKIPAPYMYDANGIASKAVKYELVKTENSYELKVIADKNVINSPDTAFPVTIDPMITTDLDPSDISCSYVESNHTSANHNQETQLLVGNDSYYYGKLRTYIKFNLPTLNKGDIVIDAKLKLYQYDESFYSEGVDDLQINAYAVTDSWSSGDLNWSNQPGTSSTIMDFDYVKRTPDWRSWNITRAVKDWYDGDLANNGIMIKAYNEGTDWANYGAYGKFKSDKYAAPETVYPYIYIDYRNNKGLEDYWTYHQASVGSAGTSYINDYSGNLVFAHTDVSTEGNKMPVAIEHVYNGYMAGNKYDKIEPFVGRGWRLNIEQTIRDSSEYGLTGTSHTAYPYVYTDADGTEHYFYNNGTQLVDEDGLGLVLVKGTTTSTITDKSDNVMTFNSDGNLKSIEDANGNKMNITYDGNQITQVTDGAGNVITISENLETGSGYIRTITDPSGHVTTFYFDAGKLIKILYPDGKSSNYEYDSDSALSKAISSGGQSITYQYTSVAKGKRVSSILEKSSSNVDGQKMTMDYSKYNETIFKTSGEDDVFGTPDDLSETYMFDNFGRTDSIKDDTADNFSLGAVKYNNYSNSTDNTYLNNTLQSEMSLGRNTRNYIINSNAESTDTWTASSWTDGCTFTSSYATDQSYYGNKSLKLNVTDVTGDGRARYYQDFTSSELVPGSTYTLSAYVKTSGISGTEAGKYGATIHAGSYASGNTLLSEYSEYITGTTDVEVNNGWRKLSVTFKVPEGTSFTRINLAIRKSTGTAWFDAVQLESGSAVNKYNFIENSSMENHTTTLPTGWSSYNLETGDEVSEAHDRLGINSFKIAGVAGVKKQLIQDIPIKGAEGDQYIISGWALANSVPHDTEDTKKFKISIKITYSDGLEKWKTPAEFNSNVSDWQYTSQTFDLSDDDPTTVMNPTKISVYLRYDNQANAAYFDDIQLIKENVPYYSYDSKGNLTSVTENGNQKSTYEYNTKSDLTKETDAKGYVTTNTYDENHNLTETKSQTDMLTNYFYTNGILSGTTIHNSTNSMIMSSSSTIDDNGYTTATTDENGYSDSYAYDEAKGLLTTYTDKLSHDTNYTYNTTNDLLESVSTVVGSDTVSNSYTYDDNYNLKTISSNGTNYTFNYDQYGNQESVYVGTNRLIHNAYNTGNGKLNAVSYENGATQSYLYNDMDLVSQLKYNNDTKFIWTYDSDGAVTRLEDLINNLNTSYVYDDYDRIIRKSTIDTTKGTSDDRNIYNIEYGYDDNNNVTTVIDKANEITRKHQYTYGEDNLPGVYTMPSGRTVTKAYDSINRLTSQTTSTDTPLVMSYIYWLSAAGNGNRTTQIKYETIAGVKYTYYYDRLGNITEILKDDNSYLKYTYNQLSELIRVDSKAENVSRGYTYDLGGNITSVSEYLYTTGELGTPTSTINYGYGDNNWKDKLTSYDGKTITYDSIGNPLTVGTDTTYTWQNGRELASAFVNGNNVSYTYNSDGLRASKTVNGTTSKYLYDGSQLVYEQRGTNDIFYYYNADGQATGLKYNDTNYYFTFNARGDIIGIYNGYGNLQASYEYNEWGKLLSVKDSAGNEITDSNNIGLVNPLRYRGYYYDADTGLYYLQSRYYNPEWGRFLNIDNLEVIKNIADLAVKDPFNFKEVIFQINNIYVYGANNPVVNTDFNGYWLSSWMRNSLKSMIKTFADDWRNNTVLNLVCLFGGGILGGIKGFKAVNNFNKTLHYYNKNPFMSTLIGTFKGMLKGFVLNIGIGRISDIISTVGKYVDFERRFDRTSPGAWIDNKITSIQKYLCKLVNKL